MSTVPIIDVKNQLLQFMPHIKHSPQKYVIIEDHLKLKIYHSANNIRNDKNLTRINVNSKNSPAEELLC